MSENGRMLEKTKGVFPMIQSVKLSKLRLSASNVRTAPDETLQIEPFAADLEARGVLQNLLVTPVSRPRGMFEVFDGGRRWRALNLLVERGVIDPEKYEVPVRIMKGDDAELTETSLAVSFQHMKLSPAEECRAFQHFLNGSTDIDGVAKRFGVTRRFIEGRLRLADLAEPIFAKLASGDLTLDMAKAEAARIGEERGLAWIRPIAGHSTWDAARSLHRISLPEQPMTLEEAERAEQIEQRMAELHDEMQNEELADEAFTALETENDRLAEELEALDRRPSFLPPELAPRVGAFLTLSQSGTMVLDETYYSETPIRVTVVEPEPVDGDVEGGQANDESDDGDAASDRVIQAPTFRIEEGATTATTGNNDKVVDPDNAAPGGKALSQVLSDQLAMQRRDVLGAALIASPGLALDYMLFAMVDGRRGASSNDGTTRPRYIARSSQRRSLLQQQHDGIAHV